MKNKLIITIFLGVAFLSFALTGLSSAQGKPDLIITSLSAPIEGRTGERGAILQGVSVTISNIGPVTSGPWQPIWLEFYWSSDAIISTDDIPAGYSAAFLSSDPDGLGPGESQTFGPNEINKDLLEIRVPPSLSPGTYYLGAIVDYRGEIEESNEQNNTRVADTGPITLKGPPPPPRLIAPSEGAVLNCGLPPSFQQTFQWEKVEQAQSYEMQVFKGSNCSGELYGGVYITSNNQRTRGMPCDGQVYSWQVFTVINNIFSAPSECWSFSVLKPNLPSPPSNLTVQLTRPPETPRDISAEVTLSWVDNSSNELAFWISRKTGDSSWKDDISMASENETTFHDNSVSPGLSYCYRVKARGLAGDSDYSNEACITVPEAPLPTLFVSLSADPSSGTAPLNDVDLTAEISGTAEGYIYYTFYCNRSDSGTDIIPGWAKKFNGILYNPTFDGCDYSEPGSYTAKVIVEREGRQAEARVTIKVDSTPIQQKGSLSISSTPTGASIYVDEVYKGTTGTTPLTIPDVLAGSRKIKFTKTNYKDCVKTIQVSAGETTNVSCSLTYQTGIISVSTDPVQGKIYVDNIYKETGSYSGSYNIGTYIVSFGDVEGYETPSTQTFTLTTEGKSIVGEYIKSYVPVEPEKISPPSPTPLPKEAEEKVVAPVEPEVVPQILQSTKFKVGDHIKIIAPNGWNMRTEQRLGNEYIKTPPSPLPKESKGQIVEHKDNGIFANGHYWWYVRFGDYTGWCAEDGLEGLEKDSHLNEELREKVEILTRAARNNLDRILENAEGVASSTGYFFQELDKGERDIIFDFASELTGLLFSSITSDASKAIHFKYTSLLSVIDEVTFEETYPGLIKTIGGFKNLETALKGGILLTQEGYKALTKAVLEESFEKFRQEGKEDYFNKIFIPQLNQQIKDYKEELNNLKENVLKELYYLDPEKAELYQRDLYKRFAGNTFLSVLYERKSVLIEGMANFKRDNKDSWSLELAKFLWEMSIGAGEVAAGLLSGGFIAPALISGSDAIREQFFENQTSLSMDGKMTGLGIETLNEALPLISRISTNTLLGLQNIKQENEPYIPEGKILNIENGRIETYLPTSGELYISDSLTPGELYISDIFTEVQIENNGLAKTHYELIITYEKPYTIFQLFPGVEITFKGMPIEKIARVEINLHDSEIVHISYEIPPEKDKNIGFYLIGGDTQNVYGLAVASSEWTEPETEWKLKTIEAKGYDLGLLPLRDLEKKIKEIKEKTSSSAEKLTEIPPDYSFTKNLSYGQNSDDVRYLQEFLKAQGDEIYPEGLVTGYFGPLTKVAVIRFQEKYADEILKPWGLAKGTGFIGTSTRTKINKLLGHQE